MNAIRARPAVRSPHTTHLEDAREGRPSPFVIRRRITRRRRPHHTTGLESSSNLGDPAAEAPGEHHQCRPEIARNLFCGDPCGVVCHLDYARRRAWRSRLPWKHSDWIILSLIPKNVRTPEVRRKHRPLGQVPVAKFRKTACLPKAMPVKSSPVEDSRILCNLPPADQPEEIAKQQCRKNCRIVPEFR